MKQYDLILIPAGERVVDRKENAIVLTIEDLIHFWNTACERMAEVMNNNAAGYPERRPIHPSLSEYLKAKGIIPTKELEDPFLQWLEEDIHDGKNLLQSAKDDEERAHIASAISTLHDVKEKYLSLKQQ